MNNLEEILDKAVKAIGKDSDRQLAIYMGVAVTTVSSWRTKRSTPDAYALMELQKILGIDARELLAIIEAERAKTEERRGYWEEIKRSFSQKGTVTALALSTALMLAGTPPNAEASVRKIANSDIGNVYYVKLTTLLRVTQRRITDLLKNKYLFLRCC